MKINSRNNIETTITSTVALVYQAFWSKGIYSFVRLFAHSFVRPFLRFPIRSAKLASCVVNVVSSTFSSHSQLFDLSVQIHSSQNYTKKIHTTISFFLPFLGCLIFCTLCRTFAQASKANNCLHFIPTSSYPTNFIDGTQKMNVFKFTTNTYKNCFHTQAFPILPSSSTVT